MKLLLTSAGRRGYLLEAFRAALDDADELHASNSIPDAPALRHADVVVIVPETRDPAFVDALVAHCERHRIDAVIPLLDVDATVLAATESRLRDVGVVVVGPDASAVEVCNDKLLMAERLAAVGVASPPTVRGLDAARDRVAAGDWTYPLVIKPRWGTGSLGVLRATDDAGLVAGIAWAHHEVRASRHGPGPGRSGDPDLLVQPVVHGTEYGLDVVCDLDGTFVGCVAREKLAMRAGETEVARTVAPERFAGLARDIAAAIRPRASIDVDLIVDGDGRAWVLDVNPRIGGGYPFDHAAGARLPELIVDWLRGRPTRPELLQHEAGRVFAKELVIAPVSVVAVDAGGRA